MAPGPYLGSFIFRFLGTVETAFQDTNAHVLGEDFYLVLVSGSS